MQPRIIDYNSETNSINITEACYLIPEIKVILDKHEDYIPYIAYCYLMSAPDSPYLNLPENEKGEVVIADVTQQYGVFEFEDRDLKFAIQKLESLYETVVIRHYKALKILIDKFSDYMITNDIMEGKDGNMSELLRIVKEAGQNVRSYKDLQKQVEEELKAKTRGDHEIGDY